MIGLERRLAALERTVSAGVIVYAWADDTALDAVARRFSEGVTHGGRVVMFRWANTTEASKP